MSGTGAVEHLFSAYTRRILAALLLADTPLHVREIARRTGIPPGSLHRELKTLAGTGLLLSARAGNQLRYEANKEHPIYTELAQIFRKSIGLADVVRDALEPVSSRIDTALIFGSMAKGESTATSDVDVMIVGEIKLADAVRALAPLRERLSREINPVVMSRVDFEKKLQKKDRFVSRVVAEPKIFLIGGPDDFG